MCVGLCSSRVYMYMYRRYSGLVDCALYFTHTFAERGSSYSAAAVTLLLDQSAVRMVEGESGEAVRMVEGGSGEAVRMVEGGSGEEESPLASVLSEALLNGIPIDTVVCSP